MCKKTSRTLYRAIDPNPDPQNSLCSVTLVAFWWASSSMGGWSSHVCLVSEGCTKGKPHNSLQTGTYNFNIPDNSSSHSICYDQACGPRVKSWLCLFLVSVTEASSTLFWEWGHRASPTALETMNGHKALAPHLKACSKHSLHANHVNSYTGLIFWWFFNENSITPSRGQWPCHHLLESLILNYLY